MSYDNRRYQKPLIKYEYEDRASSGESTGSSSAGGGYASSRTSMGSSSEARIPYKRVPDNADYYVTSTTSRNGKVQTHNHGQPRYDPSEPRSRESRYDDYNHSRRYRAFGGSRSPSQLVKTASDTPISSETNLSSSRKSAITVASLDSLPSTVSEETINGSTHLAPSIGGTGSSRTSIAESVRPVTSIYEESIRTPEQWDVIYAKAAKLASSENMPDTAPILEGNIRKSRRGLITSIFFPLEEQEPWNTNRNTSAASTSRNSITSGRQSGEENNGHRPSSEERQKSMIDIQYPLLAEASLIRSGPAATLAKFGKNSESKAQVSTESTMNITKAEIGSGTPSEILKGNEEFEGPQTTLDSTTFIVDSVNGDKMALDTQEAEGMDRDLSSSSSSDYHGSDSEQNGSDSASSELCERLDDVHVDREQIMTPILDPARQAMVDRVMEEFWVIFNTRWSSNIRQRAGDSQQESCPSGSTIAYQNTTQSRSTQGKRKRIGDEDDPDRGSDRSDQPPSQSMASRDMPADIPRFACPFRKHDPCRYSIYSHRACALSHWASIARVKEHLYRSHQMAVHCERCWQTFNNQQKLKAHITVDATEICQVKPGHAPDGLTPEMERKLRSRKKAHRDQTDEDRWKEMYRLLFPNEEVPSPYFEPLLEEAPLSPDSRDLANYEEYARRELPRLVRTSVLEVFRREMQPVEASLVANLVDTIQECQARLFRSFSERMSEDQNAEVPPSSRIDAFTSPPLPNPQYQSLGLEYPSDEGNSTHTPSNFLSASFQQPPPIQNTGFEDNFQSLDPIHSLQASNTVDASLSTFSDPIFSSSTYSSERFCNCQGHCSCTFTTTSSQSQASGGSCNQGESNVRDNTFTGQDWNTDSSWTDWFIDG